MVIINSDEVKAIRKQMGLNQTDFAERLGYSPNAHYVNMIECEKLPITAKFQKKFFELISERGSLDAQPVSEKTKDFVRSFYL
jgi:transcriptional regulator with XRE-family HTH domain